MESKVKEVHECKPYTNNYGTAYYHNLTMENGDKINIGKRNKLKVGELISYEIVGDPGQHEFTKAKTLMLDKQDRKQFTAREDSSKFNKPDYDKTQTSIIRQTCIKAASELLSGSSRNTPEEAIKAATEFEKWINRD